MLRSWFQLSAYCITQCACAKCVVDVAIKSKQILVRPWLEQPDRLPRPRHVSPPVQFFNAIEICDRITSVWDCYVSLIPRFISSSGNEATVIVLVERLEEPLILLQVIPVEELVSRVKVLTVKFPLDYTIGHLQRFLVVQLTNGSHAPLSTIENVLMHQICHTNSVS